MTMVASISRDKKQELNIFDDKLKAIKTKLNKQIEVYKGHKG